MSGDDEAWLGRQLWRRHEAPGVVAVRTARVGGVGRGSWSVAERIRRHHDDAASRVRGADGPALPVALPLADADTPAEAGVAVRDDPAETGARGRATTDDRRSPTTERAGPGHGDPGSRILPAVRDTAPSAPPDHGIVQRQAAPGSEPMVAGPAAVGLGGVVQRRATADVGSAPRSAPVAAGTPPGASAGRRASSSRPRGLGAPLRSRLVASGAVSRPDAAGHPPRVDLAGSVGFPAERHCPQSPSPRPNGAEAPADDDGDAPPPPAASPRGADAPAQRPLASADPPDQRVPVRRPDGLRGRIGAPSAMPPATRRAGSGATAVAAVAASRPIGEHRMSGPRIGARPGRTPADAPRHAAAGDELRSAVPFGPTAWQAAPPLGGPALPVAGATPRPSAVQAWHDPPLQVRLRDLASDGAAEPPPSLAAAAEPRRALPGDLRNSALPTPLRRTPPEAITRRASDAPAWSRPADPRPDGAARGALALPLVERATAPRRAVGATLASAVSARPPAERETAAGGGRPAGGPAPGPDGGTARSDAPDIGRVADRVYRLLVDRLAQEHRRRGW